MTARFIFIFAIGLLTTSTDGAQPMALFKAHCVKCHGQDGQVKDWIAFTNSEVILLSVRPSTDKMPMKYVRDVTLLRVQQNPPPAHRAISY